MFSLEGGHAAAAKLLSQNITGIVCASDPQALGAIRAVRRKGLTVPATCPWSATTTPRS